MLRVALVLLALLVAVPAPSSAGGRGFGRGGSPTSHGGGFKSAHIGGFKSGRAFAARPFHHATRSVFPRPVDPWKFWGAKHVHRPFFKSPFISSGVVLGGGTTVVYAPPVVYAPSETVVYSPPAAVYTPPPMPTVVEYPTGRYELRGDGITTAYHWVWIPKPPPAPPAPPPPEAAPEPDQSRAPERQERAIGKIYRWTDDEGVTTFTDRLENVPERYRPRAEPKA